MARLIYDAYWVEGNAYEPKRHAGVIVLIWFRPEITGNPWYRRIWS